MWNLPFLLRTNRPDGSSRLMHTLELANILTRLEVDIQGNIHGNSDLFLHFFEGRRRKKPTTHLQEFLEINDFTSLIQAINKAICKHSPQVLQTTFHFSHRKGRKTVACHVLVSPPALEIEKELNKQRIQLYILPLSLFGKELETLQVHRMTNLGSLSAGVAHDLNNLLTGINSFAALLEDNLSDTERKAYLDLIRRTVGRASKLTGGILSYIREEEEGPLSPIDPLSCIRDMTLLVKQTLSSDIQLTVDLPAKPYALLMRRSEFSQVVLNLLINARDAIEGTGQIWVSGRFEPQPKPRFFVLKVSDSGAGISPEDLSLIFQPFFSTKQNCGTSGSGLGLPIIKRIVSEAGGTVEVDSQPGSLTSFSVHLPITQENSAQPIQTKAPGGDENILLYSTVDCEYSTLLPLLSYKGYQARKIIAEREELTLKLQDYDVPDLFILDTISGLNSILESIHCIKGSFPSTPLLLTSSEIPEAGTILPSHTHFLKKPFDPQDFWLAVRHALRMQEP